MLIAAVDSLLSWPTLTHYEQRDRLLTSGNSNGFLPGEGAGAILVGPGGVAALECTGIGFGIEPSPVDAETPLRADGLTQAIKAALADAGCAMHDIDYRIADVSGEQYYFKEAALALARTPAAAQARVRPLASGRMHRRGRRAAPAPPWSRWPPRPAASGYAPGRRGVAHLANDGGRACRAHSAIPGGRA